MKYAEHLKMLINYGSCEYNDICSLSESTNAAVHICLLVIAQIFPKYTPLEKVKAKPWRNENGNPKHTWVGVVPTEYTCIYYEYSG